MKTPKKSSTIPLDEVRLKQLSDPKRTNYAIKLALEEFEQDNDVDRLLDTLRLVAQPQEGLPRWLAEPMSADRLCMRRSRRTAIPACALSRACLAPLDCA